MQDGERVDFPDNPGEQPLGVFCVIAHNHGLVAELGEHGFHPFPRFGEGLEGRFSVSLVFPAGCFQPDTGRFEKVKPHLDADIVLVPEEGAVRVAGLDILQVMEVVHARLGQAGRVDALVQPADGVQLVSVEKGAFTSALPETTSDLAQELTKDPYNFAFTGITQPYNEHILKDALLANISRFLVAPL